MLQAAQVQLVPQAFKVLVVLVLQVPQVLQAVQEWLVLRDQPVLQAHKVLVELVLLEFKAPAVPQAHKVLVELAPQVFKVLRAVQVR